LHTENQLPRLSVSALKVPGWVASYPLSSQAPTPVEVELGCDNFLVVFTVSVVGEDTVVDGAAFVALDGHKTEVNPGSVHSQVVYS
jgi:hypothetical protein